MHMSPVKHSCEWLPRKCDYRTDTQTDRQTDRRLTQGSLCATMLRRQHKKYNLCHFHMNIIEMWAISKLTIRNTAPSMTALTLTSRSNGKEIPKLSASVNISLPRPDHCFVTRPTKCSSSGVFTYRDGKYIYYLASHLSWNNVVIHTIFSKFYTICYIQSGMKILT